MLFPANILLNSESYTIYVVATTRPMSNSSTTSKSQGQISSGEHKLCNSQKNLKGNHNSILPTIYITIHGPCYDYTFTVYPTLMSMPCPHVLLLIHHISISRLACCIHMLWYHTLNSTLHLCYPCMYHVYIMRKPCC